jgi:hypothetical protein
MSNYLYTLIWADGLLLERRQVEWTEDGRGLLAESCD